MKIGVIVDNLGPNQLAYNVIKAGNSAKGLDFVAFYENLLKPCMPANFATMQMFEAWGYDGVMIATKLSSAARLGGFPFAKDRIFYVWDLEWIRMKERQFTPLASIYRSPSLKIVARSDSHKKIIEDCWNVEVAAVVDDFNLNQFNEAFKWWS